jgi:thymidylate synthase (FAD)
MKIVKQSAQILIPDDPMTHIERIGRVCYKSEDKINTGTAAKFVHNLFKSHHHAMLEHYRFIMQVSPAIYEPLSRIAHPYIEMTYSEFNGKGRYVISFSARALHNLVDDACAEHYGYLPMAVNSLKKELIAHIIKKYGCYELFGYEKGHQLLVSTGVEFIPNDRRCMNEIEWNTHGWFSAHMTTDRGISHEIVRHRRQTSFAQESTRYCNYNKAGEIVVIDQGFSEDSDEHLVWINNMQNCEYGYKALIEAGIKPQMARSVLPTCLKTEIVMTAPIYEWNHFYDLRLYGTTGAPHPLIQQLAEMIFKQMMEVFYENKN